MTAEQILWISGTDRDDRDGRALLAAEVAVENFLGRGGSVLMGRPGEDADQYAEFPRLAEQIDDVDTDALDRKLEAVHQGDADAAALAVERYSPELHAAYYFGLLMGLKIAGGAR
jgi:hypothetical protein